MIEFKNVSKKYKNGTNALQNVNLKVEAGEFVYIMGPTGAGKSTLIKLLDGEEVPTGGNILVSGKNVGRIKKSKVYLYRRQIGVVFQDYRLLPEKTVFENVAYALEVLDWPNDKIRKRVREVLKLVDLSDKANVKPRELSGGQQQRVAIARAIAKRPSILIADEPTGNLDPSMTDEMISLLEKINTEEKTTLLVVTHNDVMVEYHPKRTIRIEYGHVVEDRRMDDPLVRQDGINLKPSESKPETVKMDEPKPDAFKAEVLRPEQSAGQQSSSDSRPEQPVSMQQSVQQPVYEHSKAEEPVHVHNPEHVSETEKQDMMINEITEQLRIIEEIKREGGI